MKQETKTLILDAAEALFAEHGFDGVSIRDITAKAGVRLALVNYHFGTKEGLLEQVIARRADTLSRRREDALAEIDLATAGVETLIEAFVQPYVDLILHGGPGWRSYSRLISQIGPTGRWAALSRRYFDPTAKTFIDALSAILPGAARLALVRAFAFAISTMVAAFAGSKRVEGLSDNKLVASDISATCRALVPFLAGGIRALAAAQVKGGRKGERGKAVA